MGLSLLGVAAVASTVIPPLLSDRIPLRSAVADARDAGRNARVLTGQQTETTRLRKRCGA